MIYFHVKKKLALVAITQTLTRSDLKTIINQGSFAIGLTKLIKNPEAISSNVGFFNKGHGKSQKARPFSDHMNSETCETLKYQGKMVDFPSRFFFTNSEFQLG